MGRELKATLFQFRHHRHLLLPPPPRLSFSFSTTTFPGIFLRCCLFLVVRRRLPSIMISYLRLLRVAVIMPVRSHLVVLVVVWFWTLTLSPTSSGGNCLAPLL